GIQREAPEALIVLTGDHGRPLEARSLPPGPRRDSRGQDLHTATLHVPLLFLASWIPARRVSSPVSQLDIRPTLINLLRRHPSPQVRGESLVPAIFGSEPAHPLRPRFHERNLAERAWQPSASAAEREPLRAASVRTERWHLILDRDRRAWMLFDWREDYEERRDLLELEREPPADYPALRAMLQTFLLRPDPAPPPSRLLPPSVPRSAPVRPAAAARPTPAPADVRPEPE
ncbi:MAG: hypothetical protein OEY14_13905, partial [Myxococcales bacterium]|nr:hypothetical protein [Myxococcales bacterium]